MKKRKLGKNGPEVGAVGLGCMSFASFYGPTDEDTSHATLARAMELGVDFLDTSNVYGAGRSEQTIGAFVKQHPGVFKIASKVGIKREPGATTRTFDNSANYIRSELEKSLERLNIEQLALYYIHRRDQSIPVEEVMETLVALKKEGKIGGIGFSEISPATLRRAHAVHPVMAVQSEYSPWTRQPELGLLQACKELGVAFVPFSPVGRGIFSNSPPDPAKLGDKDFRKNNPRFIEPNYGHNLKALEPFFEMAADKGVAVATLAIAWVLGKGDNLIPIPGTRSRDHLEECAAAADLALSASEIAEIENILPVGFAHGARYTDAQMIGTESYC